VTAQVSTPEHQSTAQLSKFTANLHSGLESTRRPVAFDTGESMYESAAAHDLFMNRRHCTIHIRFVP